MIPHALLSLMLASPPAMVNTETILTYDLTKMTWDEANRLHGKDVHVSMVSHGNALGGATILVDIEGVPGVLACVRFPSGLCIGPFRGGDRVALEGELQLRLVPARNIRGKMFRKILDADIVDPVPVCPPRP